MEQWGPKYNPLGNAGILSGDFTIAPNARAPPCSLKTSFWVGIVGWKAFFLFNSEHCWSLSLLSPDLLKSCSWISGDPFYFTSFSRSFGSLFLWPWWPWFCLHVDWAELNLPGELIPAYPRVASFARFLIFSIVISGRTFCPTGNLKLPWNSSYLDVLFFLCSPKVVLTSFHSFRLFRFFFSPLCVFR